jgi:SCY1-like protein 1
MIHGNVGPNSVFVTAAGEWKLGAFEVLSGTNDPQSMIASYGAYLGSSGTPYRAPEGFMLNSSNPFSVDLYQFGCLLRDVCTSMASRSSGDPATDAMCTSASNELRRYVDLFTSHDPLRRPDLSGFLSCPTFLQSELIAVTSAMENMAVQDERERNQLIERISRAVDTFPMTFNKHKVLPILLNALEYGTGMCRCIYISVLSKGRRVCSSKILISAKSN